MTETNMYKKLKKHLSGKPGPILLQRIESGGTGLGIPDIYFVTFCKKGWIELKEIPYIPKGNKNIKIPFRPGQLAWIKNHLKYNEDVFLLCTVKGIKNSWYLFKGSHITKEYTKETFFRLNSGSGHIENIGWIYELGMSKLS